MTRVSRLPILQTSASEKHAFFLFFFLVYHIHVIVYWEHSRRGSLEKILLGKYYFPANFYFACCESQGVLVLLAGGLQREPGVDITVRKGVKYLEDQNRRYGRDKMPPLLCRILKLRESSSEQVLNDKEQKGVRVNIFLLAASKSYPFANVSIYTGLWQVYGYQQLSLTENDFHTKNDQIYNIFKCKRKILFTAQSIVHFRWKL